MNTKGDKRDRGKVELVVILLGKIGGRRGSTLNRTHKFRGATRSTKTIRVETINTVHQARIITTLREIITRRTSKIFKAHFSDSQAINLTILEAKRGITTTREERTRGVMKSNSSYTVSTIKSLEVGVTSPVLTNDPIIIKNIGNMTNMHAITQGGLEAEVSK